MISKESVLWSNSGINNVLKGQITDNAVQSQITASGGSFFNKSPIKNVLCQVSWQRDDKGDGL